MSQRTPDPDFSSWQDRTNRDRPAAGTTLTPGQWRVATVIITIFGLIAMMFGWSMYRAAQSPQETVASLSSSGLHGTVTEASMFSHETTGRQSSSRLDLTFTDPQGAVYTGSTYRLPAGVPGRVDRGTVSTFTGKDRVIGAEVRFLRDEDAEPGSPEKVKAVEFASELPEAAARPASPIQYFGLAILGMGAAFVVINLVLAARRGAKNRKQHPTDPGATP